MVETSIPHLYIITGASDTLATVDEDHPTNRFNDGKCDRLGRLWTGTMGFEEGPGRLNPHMGSMYSYTGGNLLLMQDPSLVPRPSPSFSLLTVRKGGREPGRIKMSI